MNVKGSGALYKTSVGVSDIRDLRELKQRPWRRQWEHQKAISLDPVCFVTRRDGDPGALAGGLPQHSHISSFFTQRVKTVKNNCAVLFMFFSFSEKKVQWSFPECFFENTLKLLNRPTGTWNLFVLYNNQKGKTTGLPRIGWLFEDLCQFRSFPGHKRYSSSLFLLFFFIFLVDSFSETFFNAFTCQKKNDSGIVSRNVIYLSGPSCSKNYKWVALSTE